MVTYLRPSRILFCYKDSPSLFLTTVCLGWYPCRRFLMVLNYCLAFSCSFSSSMLLTSFCSCSILFLCIVLFTSLRATLISFLSRSFPELNHRSIAILARRITSSLSSSNQFDLLAGSCLPNLICAASTKASFTLSHCSVTVICCCRAYSILINISS